MRLNVVFFLLWCPSGTLSIRNPLSSDIFFKICSIRRVRSASSEKNRDSSSTYLCSLTLNMSERSHRPILMSCSVCICEFISARLVFCGVTFFFSGLEDLLLYLVRLSLCTGLSSVMFYGFRHVVGKIQITMELKDGRRS